MGRTIIALIVLNILVYMNTQEIQTQTQIQTSYANAVNLINDTNFDELKEHNGVLLDGTRINTEPSIKYPDDRIVYYKDIALSVENNNGLAKVITAFSKNGKEISMPESGTVFTNINTVRSVLIIILTLLVIFKVIISS